MLNILRIANVRCCISPHHRGSLRVPIQRVRVQRVWVQRVQVLKVEVWVRMVLYSGRK